MNQKLLSKVLATMLAVILTFANFVMLGVYGLKSYAADNQIENQAIVSNNPNVKFDAYFANEKGEKKHTSKKDIDESEILYLAVDVEKGYLKNAKIQMLAQDGKQANFKIINNNEQYKAVESIDVDSNSIFLKQINAGTKIVLEVPIASVKNDVFDLSNLDKINNITITGSYIENSEKEINIIKTINVRNEWTKEVETVIEEETKNFIPYQIKDSKGTILQTIVKLGLENNALPIKQTKLSVKVPQINGVNLKKVVVSANTYATNNNNEFNINNYIYNPETGIIDITVNNEPNQNIVQWNKTNKDEFIITYIYEEKIDKIDTKQEVEATITVYGETEEVTQKHELNIQENKVKGNFVETQIISNNELSKGNLYTNSNKETQYNENIKLDIIYSNLVDKITVENSKDNFINSKNEAKTAELSSYYKETTINKDNFEKILGQDGYIKIFTQDGEQLVIFTKDSTLDENGNYKYEYSKLVNNMKIETSKPITEGTLLINNVKTLKGNTNYTKEQVENFTKLQLQTSTNVEYIGTLIQEVKTYKDITLVAPSTKVEVSTSVENLSTVVTNEDVELRVILKTNDISCDLYKNPVVEIELPSYVSEISIKDIDVFFDEELKIKDYNTYKNSEGKIVIKVNLEGEQTKYSQNEISRGANIVIKTDILVNKLTPTTNDVIKVFVTNENVTTYENPVQVTNSAKKAKRMVAKSNEKGYTENILKAVAPVGIVTINEISNYNSNNETVTSINGEQKTGKLEINADERSAIVGMNIINNYSNPINDIKILGRIPAIRNIDIATQQDLGSNFDAVLLREIEAMGIPSRNVTIYYSTNQIATQDLTDAHNGWTTSPENIIDVKSYLIVLDGFAMNTGDSVQFAYRVAIPRNLRYGLSTYTTYAVYYNNAKENENVAERAIAPIVGLTTGEGPVFEANVTSNIAENATLEEGDEVTYKVSIKNTGKTDITNLNVKGNFIQIGTTQVEGSNPVKNEMVKSGLTRKIEELKIGETKELIYTGRVATKTYEEETIKFKAEISADRLEKEVVVETNETTLKKGYITTKMETGAMPIDYVRKSGDEVQYTLEIKNVNEEVKENMIVTDILPEGVTFKEAKPEGATYNKETRTVTWNLGTLNAYSSKYIAVTVTVDKLADEEIEKDITNQMKIATNDKELTASVTIKVAKANLSIEVTSNTNEKVQVGDSIIYNILVKNIGAGVAENVIIENIIPDGLQYKRSEYSIDGATYTTNIGNGKAVIGVPSLKSQGEVNISIEMIAKELQNGENSKEVKNSATVSAKDINTKTSNEIKHTIIPKSAGDVKDPSTDVDEEGTYKISGVVWLDENKDGKKDNQEKRIQNITVTLIDAESGKIIVDTKTGKKKEQQTNEFGAYTFSNIKPAKYMVVFQYDTEYYGLTTYQKEGVNSDQNSDVVLSNAKIDEQAKKVATTQIITLTDKNEENIDMGLVVNPQFDLKLDKVITKISTQTNGETKEYSYKDSKFAKLDLKDKTLKDTSIVIEYKIRITNEGDVAGYAKKIIDYLPEGMKFASELNPDWYQSSNGNVYNASLSNTLINPGETKEITLLLTKKMNQDNLGLINNIAEIYESDNELGLKDIDSTAGNKVQNEDDLSNADAMIGIKTGEVYVYTTLTLVCICLLGIGAYLINKKVLIKL